MALINNDTYFVDPSRDLSQKKTYYRGLVTLLDYDMAKFSQRILQGFIKVQYHLSKSEYWVPTSILREATVTDFKIGDIVMDNTLGIIELEIIDIDISKAPPLVAVELDESRNKTTIKTYLDSLLPGAPFIMADLISQLYAAGIKTIKTPLDISYTKYWNDNFDTTSGTITDVLNPEDTKSIFLLNSVNTSIEAI
jgi:hypothetical protein